MSDYPSAAAAAAASVAAELAVDDIKAHLGNADEAIPNLSREEAWILVSRHFNKKT